MGQLINQIRLFLTTPIIGEKGTIYSVDLMRGIASVMVLIFHYRHFFFVNVDTGWVVEDVDKIIHFEYWAPIYYWGANAVQFFWVISGFIFVHVYSSKPDVTGKKFLISRFARLYPLHFVTLILVAIIQMINMHYFNAYSVYGNNDLYHFILNLFLASEWDLYLELSYNGPIWSVSAEVFSYILFFIALKTLRFNILSFASITLLSMILYALWKNLIILCLVYFFAGCVAYGLMQFIQNKIHKFSIIFWGVVFICAVTIASLNDTIQRVLLYIPAFSALLILGYSLEKQFGNAFLYKIRWIGDASFGNYLWHCPLQLIFLLGVSFGLVDFNIVFESYFLFAYITIVFVVALVSFHHFERPMQNYIRTRYS